MNWSSLEIDRQTANQAIDAAQAMFMVAAKAGQELTHLAVFSRANPGATNVTLYFAPGAKAIGAALGASPCERPNRERLTLLAGDARFVEGLFR